MQVVSCDAHEKKQGDGCDFCIASVLILPFYLKIVQKNLKNLNLVR